MKILGIYCDSPDLGNGGKKRCDSTCLTRKLFLKNLAGQAPQLYLGRTME